MNASTVFRGEMSYGDLKAYYERRRESQAADQSFVSKLREKRAAEE